MKKTGNVNQVAAFGKLVGICSDLGARYNPAKEAITPTALRSLLEQAQQTNEAVNVARITLTLAINARNERTAGIRQLAARVVRAAKVFESSTENIEDAIRLKNWLWPHNKAAAPTPAEPASENSAPKGARSFSRLAFDNKVETLELLVKLLERIPAYQPHEPELQVVALKTVLMELKNSSMAVVNAYNALDQARSERNRVMYGPSGVYRTALTVKDYIRAVYGLHSELARQVGQIRIVNPKP